jgi:hypothetical protein
MATFRKSRRTGALIWSVIFLLGAPAYISIREAVRPLASFQLGTLGISFAIALVPIAIFAWIFRGTPSYVQMTLTFVFYLTGAWFAFNIATVFRDDPQWGWAYGPRSWVYVVSEYVQVLDEFQGENFLPVTESFWRIASGQAGEGDRSIVPRKLKRREP